MKKAIVISSAIIGILSSAGVVVYTNISDPLCELVSVINMFLLLLILMLTQQIGLRNSELAKINKDLKQSEELYRLLFDAANDIIFIHPLINNESQGNFIRVNQKACEVLGYSHEEFLKLSPLDIITEDSFENIPEECEKLENQKHLLFEKMLVAKSGQKIPVEINANIFDFQGKTTVLSIARDVSERKQAEKMLLASENKYRTLFDNNSDGLLVADIRKRHFISANRKICEMFGYSESELLSLRVEDIHPEADIPFVIREFEALVKGEKRLSENIPCLRKDRSIFFAEISATPLEIDGELCVIGIFRDVTERKQTEARLRKNEETLAKVFRASPGGIAITTMPEGRFVDVNEAFLNLFGYSREELIGKTSPELNIWADANIRNHAVASVHTRKKDTVFEAAFRRKNNELFYALVSLTPIHIDGTDCILTIGIDITDRKKSVEALKASEERYRTLVESIPGAVYRCELYDPWRIEHISAEAKHITGYSVEEFVFTKIAWGNLIHPEDKELVNRSVEDGIHFKRPYDMEYRIIRKDGAVRWVYEKGKTLYSETGGALCLEGVILDITERKQAENALKDSENKYRSMYCAMSEGVALHEIVYDDAGIAIDYRIIDVNPAYEKLTDIRKKDVVGSLASQLYRTGSPPYIEIYGKVAESGEPFHFETYFAPMKKHFSMSAYSPKKGQFVTIFSDITDRKTDEEERKKLESRLRQAQNMEALGTLAGGIAHDFNNILFPIMGYTEMTMDDLPEDSSAYKNLKEILKAAHRAKELVDQILTFSRQREHEKNMIHIQPIVKETLKLIRATLPATIKLVQKIAPNCASVMGDPVHIHQIVMNLCTNAYHAMQDKGGILEVNLIESELTTDDLREYPDSLPGNYLRLSVSDTGVGIRSDILERIFDPFFTTKPVGKGTGLGLSVIHGIVKKMGGHIMVYSQPEQGSVFHVYLPAITPEITYTPDSSDSDGPIQMGSERILLVDDEEPILTMLHKMLEELGYKVSPRTSSVEAFKAFENKPDCFDLVITDMTMPNMTGAYLARKIMAIRNDIPIILCTGFSEHINAEKSKELGIRGYLMKPVIRADIAKMIRKVLEEVRNENREGGIGL